MRTKSFWDYGRTAGCGLWICLAWLVAGTAWGQALLVNGYVNVGQFGVTNAGVTAWAPTNVTGCVVWYDVTNQTGQAEGATLQWSDQSGNGYTATNGVTANRPYLTNNFINGSYSAMYAPGNRGLFLLLAATNSIRNVAGATFVGVVRFTAATGYGHAFFASTASGAGTARFTAGAVGSGLQGGRARHADADTGVNATAAIANGTAYVLSVVCDYVGGTIKCYTNGVAGVTGTLATSGSNCEDKGSILLTLFQNGTSSETMNGGIGGLAVWNRALSDSDRQTAEAWYHDRFGFTY